MFSVIIKCRVEKGLGQRPIMVSAKMQCCWILCLSLTIFRDRQLQIINVDHILYVFIPEQVKRFKVKVSYWKRILVSLKSVFISPLCTFDLNMVILYWTSSVDHYLYQSLWKSFATQSYWYTFAEGLQIYHKLLRTIFNNRYIYLINHMTANGEFGNKRNHILHFMEIL